MHKQLKRRCDQVSKPFQDDFSRTGASKQFSRSVDEKQKKRKKHKSTKTEDKVRKLQLLEANAEEEHSIKRLEKALKLNRRKKKKKNSPDKPEAGQGRKSIHRMFVDDGLDYLLDVVDSKGDILDSDVSDVEGINEDLAVATGKVLNKRKKDSKQILQLPPKKPRRLADLLNESASESEQIQYSEEEDEDDMGSEGGDDQDSVSNSEDNFTDNDDEQSFNECDDSVPVSSVSAVKKRKEQADKPEVWEDIYGRLRDKSGKIITSKNEAYVPPAKRLDQQSQSDEDKRAEIRQKIQRQLKGLINRLSESNMQPISSQIEEMYMKNSRNDLNEVLLKLICELVISPVTTPPRLIMEQAMLIALLHANVGSEIGAYFLQRLTMKLNELMKSGENYGEGKESDNLLSFVCHLYNYKVTSCLLIFDILKLLIDSFQDKDIELILQLLRSVGFTLRKDDPLKLKEVILSIQAKAPTFQSKEDSSRIQFMLETLTAIRNNNMYKIPNYDPSVMDHMKKVLRGILRPGASVQELVVSFEDLLKAEERGRWWIIGSAWTERSTSSDHEESATTAPSSTNTEVSEKILELARKQHMNSGIRKTIFCIIMTAEDYMDAFDKLLRLNLKNQQEQEIINVIVHCTLHEKQFNPYYAYLAGKFCKFARKYHMNLQFSLWDRFKELSNFKPYQIKNLASFLTQLFLKGDLPISVLKVIHFSEMNKQLVRFFRQILLGILLHEKEEESMNVFVRIAPAKNLSLLREGLRLFMHHFLLRNESAFEPAVREKLQERIKLAEKALNSAKHVLRL